MLCLGLTVTAGGLGQLPGPALRHQSLLIAGSPLLASQTGRAQGPVSNALAVNSAAVAEAAAAEKSPPQRHLGIISAR